MRRILLMLLLCMLSIVANAQFFCGYQQRVSVRVRVRYVEREPPRCECYCHHHHYQQERCCGYYCEPQPEQQCYREEYTERQPERVVYRNEETVVGWTIGFKLDSFEIDYNNTDANTNIMNIVEFLNRYPNATIHLYGYADRNTGNSQYNMRLSENRCMTILNKLVNGYGIAYNRIQFTARGSDEQKYSVNNYNRCVYVKAIK